MFYCLWRLLRPQKSEHHVLLQSGKGDLVFLPKIQQFCLFVSNISSHFSANLTRMIHRPPHAKVQNKSVFIPFKPFGPAVPRDLLCSLSVHPAVWTLCVCVLSFRFLRCYKGSVYFDLLCVSLCVFSRMCACACKRHRPRALPTSPFVCVPGKSSITGCL